MFSLGEKIEFLLGNAFSTPVGQRIERATSGYLHSEDWGLNMEICDIINETEEGPTDAVKAIKRRIIDSKNFREIMLALTVLEACVKNCGHRFHVLVTSREFVEGVLVRSILPKYNPPTALHDRVLSLIQSWADAFRSVPSLVGVVYVYDDLRKRGLEFPMTDLDALSPIHTPSRSIPENETQVTNPSVSQSQSQPPSSQHTPISSPPVQGNTEPGSLTAEQEQKLRSELALVKGNLTIMSEMLNEMKPGQSGADDTELLQQLYSVCKNMQTRVVELIPQLVDESFINVLLVINDDLNNAFIRYERFDRQNKAHLTNPQETGSLDRMNLIELNPQPTTVNQPAVLPTNSQPEASLWNSPKQPANQKAEEEFDMFAQTRGSSLAEQRKSVKYEDPGAVEGLAGALDSKLLVFGSSQEKNSVQNDIDRWLSDDQSAVSEGMSSQEFERFLEGQVNTSDQMNGSSCPPTSRPPSQSNRQQEQTDDRLFSL